MEKKQTVEEKDIKLSFFETQDNIGKWRLTYIISPDEIHKFSLATLVPYDHPITGQKYMPSHKGQPLAHFVIDQVVSIFNVAADRRLRNILDWLITHPEVEVEGLSLEEKILNRKIKPKFKLVNLDRQDLNEMDENNIIDEMVGRLSFSTGAFAVGIKKLRFIAASLDIHYKDKRHCNVVEREKKHLRNRLKKYVRRGKKEATLFESRLKNISSAERMFALKVLMEKKEVTYESGIYKYKGSIIGSSFQSAISFLELNTDIHAEMLSKAINHLKSEGFTI